MFACAQRDGARFGRQGRFAADDREFDAAGDGRHPVLAGPVGLRGRRRCVNLVALGPGGIAAAGREQEHAAVEQPHQITGQHVGCRELVEVQRRAVRKQDLDATGFGAEPVAGQQRKACGQRLGLCFAVKAGGAVDVRHMGERRRRGGRCSRCGRLCRCQRRACEQTRQNPQTYARTEVHGESPIDARNAGAGGHSESAGRRI